ncbi:MAG: AAA family ATPase [Nanoarchaeota archaeon]
MSKVIGIIAIKGGVGKTSCSANLGAALAYEFNKRVLLVDANFSAPNLALHFGLADPEATLHDTLSNKAKIGDAIYEYDKNLHIIPGSMLNEKINPFKLREKLHKLKDLYDVIIIDSSPNLNNEILATMLASDELFVVTSPDFPTLSCTMHAVKVAKQRKTPISGLILNRTRNKGFELTLEDIEKNTGVPIVAVLKDDIKVLESVANTKPVVVHSPLSDVSIEYKKLAAAIVNEDYDDPRFFNKLIGLFNKKVQKSEINRNLLREGKLY